MLFFSPNTPPCRAGSRTTTFACFVQEREDKVWDFAREGNKVEHVVKTIGMEGHMGDLHLPFLVLKLQKLKHDYGGAGWKQKVVEFQTVPSPAAPLGSRSRKNEEGQTQRKTLLRAVKLHDSPELQPAGVPPGSAFAWLASGYICPIATFFCGQQKSFGAGRHLFHIAKWEKDPQVPSGGDHVLTIAKAGGKCFSKTSLYPLLRWLRSPARTLLHAKDLFHFKSSPSFPPPYPGW